MKLLIFRALPSVSSFITWVSRAGTGQGKVNDLLEIDLKDLLGRDSVKPNKNLFKEYF